MGSRSEPAPARGRGRRYDTTTATATSVRLAWAGPSWSDANGRAECVRQATHSASASAGIFACRDEALLHSHHGQLVARTHGRRTIEVIMKARLVPAWLPFMSTEAREGGGRRGTNGPRATDPPSTVWQRPDAYGAYASKGPDAACGFPLGRGFPLRRGLETSRPRHGRRDVSGRSGGNLRHRSRMISGPIHGVAQYQGRSMWIGS